MLFCSTGREYRKYLTEKIKIKQGLKLTTVEAPSFSCWSAHASMQLIILFWIKLNEDLSPPGLGQTTHMLAWAACWKSLLMQTLSWQCHLIWVQEGDAPIMMVNAMWEVISQGEKKKKAQLFLMGKRRVESSTICFSSRFPPASVCRLEASLASMSSESWLGAPLTLAPLSPFHHWSGSGKAPRRI